MKKSTQSLLVLIVSLLNAAFAIGAVVHIKAQMITNGYSNGYETFQFTGWESMLIVLGTIAVIIIVSTVSISGIVKLTNKRIQNTTTA